jgi:tetratricopeptide (TPR) repeat protein
MNRAQWITAGLAILLVFGIYSATQGQLFGMRKHQPAATVMPGAEETSFTIDSVLYHEKEHLSKEQVSRLAQLENSITRGDVVDQKVHLYHQLARFWADTAKAFTPYAWYTAEAARLENSEKSLTFAARLFLEGLKNQQNPSERKWEALQAKDLFERSLKINPNNDSSKVNLGAVYLYGGLAMPMQGIGMIKEVADRDSTNIHAQLTLGEASLTSGQLDKAIDRFERVVRIDPSHIEAMLRLAEIYEQQGDKAAATRWYQRSLPYSKKFEGLTQEIEKRIADLKK